MLISHQLRGRERLRPLLGVQRAPQKRHATGRDLQQEQKLLEEPEEEKRRAAGRTGRRGVAAITRWRQLIILGLHGVVDILTEVAHDLEQVSLLAVLLLCEELLDWMLLVCLESQIAAGSFFGRERAYEVDGS